eukprot:TRINITY_DN15420_c0_g1_i1.p1 TRINITY_DN15420_c0_g1~~TRINITY_DN15420_c0_g1_i1.p1  ORF type:complete len:649 (-),score=159.41 TRINITY_DN15420_c0_g1_i1:13-1755(-)
MAKGQEQHGSRTGGRDKRVQRSKTDAHHSSASPARVPRRKHSQKTRAQPTIDQNCRICYGEFTQPKQLPCLHTFCQNCLEKFVNPKLLVECPTCREETQLTVLGVAALPDNLAVGILRLSKDTEASSPAVQRRGNQRTISESGLNIGDPLSMKRQLQISFSNLEEFETTFQADIQELSQNINNTIERKMEELTEKKDALGQQLKKILKDKLELHENWRSQSEDLIERIDDEKLKESSAQHTVEMNTLGNSFGSLISKMDRMCAEKVSFDPDSLSLNCKQSNPLEETKVARNASQNKLPALSTDFYKVATLEEVRKMKWQNCLQPRCAVICPWTGQIWVCSSGSREIAIFDSDDTFVHSFTNSAFLFPCSIAFKMETMEAFVLDKRQSSIFVVSPTYQVTRSIAREGKKSGCLNSPTALVLDNKGRLIVSDNGNDRIQVLDTDGTYVAYIGLHHQEDGKGYIQELSSPGGIALSVDGKAVAVADTGNCRIKIYSANSGRSLQCFGMRGRANGQLEKPIDVSWDTQGHLLVLDEGRVQVFTENGEFLRAVKVKEHLTGMSAIGQCVLLSDTYCVNKMIWKIK